MKCKSLLYRMSMYPHDPGTPISGKLWIRCRLDHILFNQIPTSLLFIPRFLFQSISFAFKVYHLNISWTFVCTVCSSFAFRLFIFKLKYRNDLNFFWNLKMLYDQTNYNRLSYDPEENWTMNSITYSLIRFSDVRVFILI